VSNTSIDTFGIPFHTLRNDNIVTAIRTAADRLEKRIEAVKSIGTMENFWKADVEWIKNGELTSEPFDPTAGIVYQSVTPIRLVIDPYTPMYDVDHLMKRAFRRYAEKLVEFGGPMPTFNSRWDGLRFRLKTTLTKWGLI
jgi:hypothetical protein